MSHPIPISYDCPPTNWPAIEAPARLLAGNEFPARR
jgi:hypothetical protein